MKMLREDSDAAKALGLRVDENGEEESVEWNFLRVPAWLDPFMHVVKLMRFIEVRLHRRIRGSQPFHVPLVAIFCTVVVSLVPLMYTQTYSYSSAGSVCNNRLTYFHLFSPFNVLREKETGSERLGGGWH